MREIKFRVWLPKEKMMQDGDFHIGPTGVYYGWNPEEDEYNDKKIEPILMQFTGLLDKNGKEIYSGDLLRHNEGSKSYEVMWNGYGFWELDGSCLGMVMRDNPNGLEIVGNIYELLK